MVAVKINSASPALVLSAEKAHLTGSSIWAEDVSVIAAKAMNKNNRLRICFIF